MFFSYRKHRVLLSLFSLLFFCSQTIFAGDVWREISAAEMQMKTPQVEADADAEAIFWEVRVDDSSTEFRVMKHYIRVKIFTERGREKYSKVDIPFIKGVKIKDVEARVIKPDGSIVELNKQDVFEREIAKAGNAKLESQIFCRSEYRAGRDCRIPLSGKIPEKFGKDMRMIFQHDIPDPEYYLLFQTVLRANYLTFNMGDQKFIKDKSGFYRATMENIPSIKEEPRMPPEDEIRPWASAARITPPILRRFPSHLHERPALRRDYWAGQRRTSVDQRYAQIG